MVTLHHGDCLEVMAAMDAESVDAIVTDPPYGLSFMGKEWDGLPPGQLTSAAMYRVLRPSSYLLAFGGTRTWHRLACALEDAGFEIRDTLMWLYGSGFPKGKSCLKPAWEPVILARKPGKMRELGIEECRVATTQAERDWMEATARPNCETTGRGQNYGTSLRAPAGFKAPEAGRWPANVVLDEVAAAMVDEQSGWSSSSSYRPPDRGGSGNVYTVPHPIGGIRGMDDSGGASRFYYCAKASRSERNAGLEGMEPRQNHHPTVKPISLMRWLVRLVARPGETVFDPFMGSGTTGVACAKEGRDFIGIEREAEYIEIARRRIEAAEAQTMLAV